MISVIAAINTFLLFLRAMVQSSSSQEESSEVDQSVVENNVLKKGPWTAEEDAILAEYVTKNGVGNWNTVQKNTGLARCGKSCRLRWTNHLRPDLKKGSFTIQEQNKIVQLHALLGNKWARMAQELPGRTDNEIKNFWNTRQKKRKRAGLPLYPDDIKPIFNIDTPKSSVSASTHHQHANDSQAGTSSSYVPELVFNNYKLLNQKHLLHIPPISLIPENKTFERQGSDNQIMHPQKQQIMQYHDSDMLHTGLDNATPAPMVYNQFQGKDMPCGYACSSGSSSILELPSSPSFDDDSLRVREDPPAETQYYEPCFPRSKGYLESIFCPPKVLEGSMQGESNSGNKDNSDKTNLVNQDASGSGDFVSRVENYDRDRYALKDTLLSVIYPFFHTKHS